jgi:hypothetical protein
MYELQTVVIGTGSSGRHNITTIAMITIAMINLNIAYSMFLKQ